MNELDKAGQALDFAVETTIDISFMTSVPEIGNITG